MEKITEFTLDYQWNLYLERSGVKEENLHPTQIKQLKQAFYACAHQLLNLLVTDFHALSDEKGADALEDMIRQCNDFWIVEKLNQN